MSHLSTYGIPLDELAQHRKDEGILDCESCCEPLTDEDKAKDSLYCLECHKVYDRQTPDPQEATS